MAVDFGRLFFTYIQVSNAAVAPNFSQPNPPGTLRPKVPLGEMVSAG